MCDYSFLDEPKIENIFYEYEVGNLTIPINADDKNIIFTFPKGIYLADTLIIKITYKNELIEGLSIPISNFFTGIKNENITIPSEFIDTHCEICNGEKQNLMYNLHNIIIKLKI